MELLNRVMVIGRLTKDPDLQKTQSGHTIAKITVATDRPTKDEKTDYIDCIAWDRAAEIVDRFGRKGNLVYVEGRLEIDSYKAADGSNKYIARVNLSKFLLLEKPQKTDPHAGLVPQAEVETERYSDDMFSRAIDIDPNDLPF